MFTLVVLGVKVDSRLVQKTPHGLLVVGHAGDHQWSPTITVLGVQVYALHSAENIDDLLPAPRRELVKTSPC